MCSLSLRRVYSTAAACPGGDGSSQLSCRRPLLYQPREVALAAAQKRQSAYVHVVAVITYNLVVVVIVLLVINMLYNTDHTHMQMCNLFVYGRMLKQKKQNE
eukprot:GHVS01102531.1.p1 GENE.GHVS01102531.1~~GHVS01102531.1.p1  ORF type:complete len:102 (-),score=18.40 GHVS01102531.1:4-309(-)